MKSQVLDFSIPKAPSRFSNLAMSPAMTPSMSVRHQLKRAETCWFDKRVGTNMQFGLGRYLPKNKNKGETKDGHLVKNSDNLKSHVAKPSGILTSLFFLNTNKIFKISQKRMINRRDVGSLPDELTGEKSLERFLMIYYKDKDRREHIELWLAIYRYENKTINLALFLRILSDGIMVSTPLLFRELSSSLKKSNIPIEYSVFLIIGILVSYFTQDILRQHSEKYISKAKASIGQALRSFLFERLSNADYIFLTTTEPNFLSRMIFFELDHLLEFIHIIPSLISGPITLIISSTLVVVRMSYYLSFWLNLTGTIFQVALLFLFLLKLNRNATHGRDRYFAVQAKQTTVLQELVSCIEEVKANHYEKFFEERLGRLRNEAEKALQSVHFSYGIIEFLLIMGPFLFSCGIVVFSNYVIQEKVQTNQIFTIIAMMIAVGVPLRSFSDSLKSLNMFQVAYNCVKMFFDNVSEYNKKDCPWDSLNIKKGEIVMIDCCFTIDMGSASKIIQDIFEGYTPKSKTHSYSLVRARNKRKTQVVSNEELRNMKTTTRKKILSNLGFYIKRGDKICILGREDSGKKYFFLAILTQIKLISGTFKRNGKIAFLDMTDQKYLRGTVRENIVLGEEYVPEKLVYICKVVGLQLENFPGRDLTEIVEGQRNITYTDRKKILLARMLYSEADIYLINYYFDQLGRDQQQKVFRNIVRTHLHDKTVLYTSNANLLIKLSDRVFVFKDGNLAEKESYDELIRQRKSVLYEIVMTDSTGSSNFLGKILEGVQLTPQHMTKEEIELYHAKSRRNNSNINSLLSTSNKMLDRVSASLQQEENQRRTQDMNFEKWIVTTLDKARGKSLREEEEIVQNNISRSLKKLAFSGGRFSIIVLLLCFVLTDIALVFIQLWIALWGVNSFELTYEYNLLAFLTLIGILGALVIIREYLFTKVMLSNLSHNYRECITRMLKADKRWFDENPANRIVYLLTKDQTIIDNELLRSMFTLLDSCLVTIIIFVTMNYIYFGTMFVLTIVFILVSLTIISNFERVSQRLLAFTNRSRAELIDTYLETYNNLTMLRANQQESHYKKSFYEKTDSYQLVNSALYNNSMRWLNIRISMFSLIVILSVTGLPFISSLIDQNIYLTHKWQLSYALGIVPFLLASILNLARFYPQTMLHLTSAQRVFREFIDLSNLTTKTSRLLLHNKFKISKPKKSSERRKHHLLSSGSISKPLNTPEEGLTRRMSRMLSVERPSSGSRLQTLSRIATLRRKSNFSFTKTEQNEYKSSIKPLILMDNVNFSTHNRVILKNICLSVHEAEKVAIVEQENYGRLILLKLILLLEERDKDGYEPSQFDLFGTNVDKRIHPEVKKNFCFLSQYPSIFNGTVQENLDPSNKHSEEEMIRTLHFLKGFEAIQKFTGFKDAENIAITLKQIEGKIEIREVELEDFHPAYERSNKRRRRSAKHQIVAVKNSQNKKLIEGVNNRAASMIEDFPIDSFEADRMDGNTSEDMDDRWEAAQKLAFKEVNNFFKKQHDNEIPIAERAKRIDRRTQAFDNDYDSHRIIFSDEKMIMKQFLKMEVGKNGKNINVALKKIIQLSRAFLNKPRLIVMDEDALIIPEFDNTFFIETLFNELKSSGIFSIIKNYRNLYLYNMAYIMKQGEFIERGSPLRLVDDKSSYLYRILVKDDIRTVRQLENRIEKNRMKFEKFLDENLFNIQNKEGTPKPAPVSKSKKKVSKNSTSSQEFKSDYNSLKRSINSDNSDDNKYAVRLSVMNRSSKQEKPVLKPNPIRKYKPESEKTVFIKAKHDHMMRGTPLHSYIDPPKILEKVISPINQQKPPSSPTSFSRMIIKLENN